jgi:hypothetical protein
LGVGALLVLCASCSKSLTDICDEVGDECGASDAQIRTCRAYAAFADELVEGTPCEDEYHALISCVSDGDLGDLCNAEDIFAVNCEAEVAALDSCGE